MVGNDPMAQGLFTTLAPFLGDVPDKVDASEEARSGIRAAFLEAKAIMEGA